MEKILCPDIGADSAEIIEILVNVGDVIDVDQEIVTLESDKASMDVPSSFGGEVVEILVKLGDKISQDNALIVVKPNAEQPASPPQEAPQEQVAVAVAVAVETQQSTPAQQPQSTPVKPQDNSSTNVDTDNLNDNLNGNLNDNVYAGPYVRAISRKMGVDLNAITNPTGEKGRITREDVYSFIKNNLNSGGGTIANIQLPDFSQFGDIEITAMNRLQKITAEHMSNINLTVPQVTQHDTVNIADLEEFRASLKKQAEKRNTRITLLPFIIKACAHALVNYPQFNVSIDQQNNSIINKKYINIGFACDTPKGLFVPVIKDVANKSIWDLAQEIIELAGLAKSSKIKPEQMQGSCFTVSSLGSVGGSFFTPIVNAPEVAILGVGRTESQPIFGKNDEVIKGLMLPLSLSYDHRALNGADGARFITYIKTMLGDIRNAYLM